MDEGGNAGVGGIETAGLKGDRCLPSAAILSARIKPVNLALHAALWTPPAFSQALQPGEAPYRINLSKVMYSFRSLGVALDGSDENGTMFGTPSNFNHQTQPVLLVKLWTKAWLGHPPEWKPLQKER